MGTEERDFTAGELDRKLRRITEIYLQAGMRWGELIKRQCPDVDWKARTSPYGHQRTKTTGQFP